MSGGWFSRLKTGLSKSSDKLAGGITDAFTKRKLDDAALEELQDILIAGDLGPQTAIKLTEAIAKNRYDREISATEIRTMLSDEISKILTPIARPLAIDKSHKPHIILVVGVNGSGKTTTIGKLAKYHRQHGRKVIMAAGDTFRAAAVEQLKIWGERTGCFVVAGPAGADAAGLAFDALEQAKAQNADMLLIDTAGRLQNKKDLMAELEKVIRVIKKQIPQPPHDVLLVLDATVGQNAHSQVQIFHDTLGVTGLAITKLDGTAKGGVLVALAEKFALPVHLVGVGEQADDMRPFEAAAYARSLMGLD